MKGVRVPRGTGCERGWCDRLLPGEGSWKGWGDSKVWGAGRGHAKLGHTGPS